MPRFILVTALLGLSAAALAQDDPGDLSIEDIMAEINLGSGPGAGTELSYEGMLSESAPEYAPGTTVTIAHAGGNITVRCMDQEGMTARLAYTVYGTREPPMEAFGKGIGLSAWGKTTGGGVKTRIPYPQSGVNRADIGLTVNLPRKANVVVQGGKGWVQIQDCEGTVRSSNGEGGAYVSGKLSTFDVSATKGDVKVVLDDASEVAGSNRVNAPGGSVELHLPMGYAGRFTARGDEVSVFHTVMGTNSANLVEGTISTGNASLTIVASGAVKVKAPE